MIDLKCLFSKKIIYILISILIVSSISGCWNRKEPKTLAIVDSALYDIKDNGDYRITLEILNPAAIGTANRANSNQSSFLIISDEGKTLSEALRNISTSLDKNIFAFHNKIRFFSEKLAKNDITPVMDYILRDGTTNEKPLIFVIKGNPELIYNGVTGLSDTVGIYLENISKSQPYTTSKSVFINSLQFADEYYKEGKEPVAGLVELIEKDSKLLDESNKNTQNNDDAQSDQKKYKIVCEGLAAFRDNKLVGYLNGEETRAYNFIMNNIKNSIISLLIENEYTAFFVQNSKSKIKTIYENDQINFNVDISVTLSITEENGAIDITKPEILKKIENDLNKELESQISAAIKKVQNEFKSDIFGFGNQFHKDQPKIWKQIKDDWNNQFSNAKINITVKSTITKIGQMNLPFKWRIQ